MSPSCTVSEIYSKILADNRHLNLPHLYLTPPLGVTPSEFRSRKREKIRVLAGVVYMMKCRGPRKSIVEHRKRKYERTRGCYYINMKGAR